MHINMRQIKSKPIFFIVINKPKLFIVKNLLGPETKKRQYFVCRVIRNHHSLCLIGLT